VTSPVLAPAAYGSDNLLDEVAQGASSLATQIDAADLRFTGRRGSQSSPDHGEALLRRRYAHESPFCAKSRV
jgi:hypothetical protein